MGSSDSIDDKRAMAGKLQSYIAHASVSRRASPARVRSAFKIEVRFVGGLNATHRAAFKAAADRWTRVIIGDLPPAKIADEEVDDLRILAEGRDLDGPEQVLGQSGPTLLRPKSAGPFAHLPIQGEMTFDMSDLDAMHREGTLEDVIAHEMGHVLGFGTIWARKRMLVAARSYEPTFRGRQARAQYGRLLGSRPQAVPVENLGGAGTRNSHWREAIFGNELMSGFVATAPNPLSALTIASLADLGYAVDMTQAEAYELPSMPRLQDTNSVAYRVLSHLRPTQPVTLTA